MTRTTIIHAGRASASPQAASRVRRALFVQLQVAADCGSDLGWAAFAQGIDLLLADPRQANELYRYAWLVGRLPVRVSIPSIPAVTSAVRIATGLGMAVKLAFPPDQTAACDELADVLELYLHGRFVTRPVEPFHSLLQAMFHRRAENVWCVQEEDPAEFCYVSAEGRRLVPDRFARTPSGKLDQRFVTRWGASVSRAGGVCDGCPFVASCRGYFQWPEPSPQCKAKPLLARIASAAERLADDVQGREERWT